MDIGSFSTMNEAYPALVQTVDEFGHKFVPRSQPCREIRPASFKLVGSPGQALYSGTSRRLNYRFFAIETLGYIAGAGAGTWFTDLVVAVNKNLGQFVNKGTGLFDGVYGVRLARSMEHACALLQRDPHTRQAVASIWQPGIPEGSLDVPCTVAMQFMSDRNNSLDLSVFMRSNDLNWGTPYDVAAFCTIQAAVAKCLGVRTGAYYHQAGSLHTYDATPPTVLSQGETFADFSWWDPYRSERPGNDARTTWRALASEAFWILRQAHAHWMMGRGWDQFDIEEPMRASDDANMWARMIRGGRQ